MRMAEINAVVYESFVIWPFLAQFFNLGMLYNIYKNITRGQAMVIGFRTYCKTLFMCDCCCSHISHNN